MRLLSAEGYRALALEHARTDTYRRRVESAVLAIRVALGQATHPYVAFSGGKDSLVLLALVEAVSGGVTAAWSDDELEYPETVAMMEALRGELMFVVTGGVSRHAGWFDPWTDRPFWREPMPETTWIAGDQDDYMATLGYDLTFVGTRAEESRKRRDWLLYANARWGGTYPVRGGTGLRCCPLWDWTVDDIWAYTYAHNLPVNSVYHRLSEIGVEPRRQRIGPLPLARRVDLEDGWPDLLAALEARYGPRWS